MSKRTQDKIKKTEQALNRLERNLSLQKVKERKADTRRKIQFGGLVIKAGLDQYDSDVILGAMIHAVEQLRSEEGTESFYESIGESDFMEYGK